MSSAIDAPVTLRSQSLTQNVTIVIGIGIDYYFTRGYDATSTLTLEVTNGELSMSQWTFKSTLRPSGQLTVVSELVDVVNDSEVKVMLRGVVLDSSGSDSNIRSSAWDEVKKGEGFNLNLGNTSDENWIRFKRSCSQYDNMITARLDMTVEYLNETIPHKEAAQKRFSEVSLQDFSEAMKDLLASTSFTNARIVCTDGVEIAVNKEILARRSSVFEAMFRTDMQEAATGVVQVSDICGKSMKVFVEYLTTGKLDQSWREADVVTDLAIAADKYGIQSLHDFLDDWLGEEDLVRSNLELLNMAADCGYPKAEVKIARNVGRRAKDAKTRDEFLAAIGMVKGDKVEKKSADKQLMRWMNNQFGDQLTAAESNLELVNLAADEGLRMAELKMVQELGNRLALVTSRDEVLQVLGIGGK